MAIKMALSSSSDQGSATHSGTWIGSRMARRVSRSSGSGWRRRNHSHFHGGAQDQSSLTDLAAAED
jgi:hypothetical protein